MRSVWQEVASNKGEDDNFPCFSFKDPAPNREHGHVQGRSQAHRLENMIKGPRLPASASLAEPSCQFPGYKWEKRCSCAKLTPSNKLIASTSSSDVACAL
jgi:hypothetical protein